MSRNIFRQFDNFLEGNKCRGDFLKSFAQIFAFFHVPANCK